MKYFVVSYGGVGTHMLMPMIDDEDWLGHTIKSDNKKDPMRYPHHMRYPPASFKEHGYDGQVKVIYVFGNPINSVLSHFRRRIANKRSWCRHACLNLGGDYKKFKASWDLQDYLNNGEDLFKLEEHFDNWTTLSANAIDYEYMILKYETADRHETEIQAFLDSDLPLNFKKRNSDWRSEAEETKQKLVEMYGSLLAKCENFDEIKRVL